MADLNVLGSEVAGANYHVVVFVKFGCKNVALLDTRFNNYNSVLIAALLNPFLNGGSI